MAKKLSVKQRATTAVDVRNLRSHLLRMQLALESPDCHSEVIGEYAATVHLNIAKRHWAKIVASLES